MDQRWQRGGRGRGGGAAAGSGPRGGRGGSGGDPRAQQGGYGGRQRAGGGGGRWADRQPGGSYSRRGGGRGGGGAFGRGDAQPDGRQRAAVAQDAATSAAPPAIAAYLRRWHPLVDAEMGAEQAAVQERLETWPTERLQREGLVLLDLCAVKRGSLYGVPIWVLRSAERRPGALPYHRFSQGDEVLISRDHPLRGPGKPWTGTVLERGSRELRVVCADRLPGDVPLRVDKGVNTIVYERMRAALNSLARPPTFQQQQQQQQHAPAASASNQPSGWPEAEQQQQPQRCRGGGKRGRHDDEADSLPPGTALAALLVSPSRAVAARPSEVVPPAALEWARGVLQQQQQQQQQEAAQGGLADSDDELGLNRSQALAIATALTNTLSLVHGPPGTGKTTTTVALLALLARRFAVGLPLLAVGQSNVAVDNLLEGLVDAGVSAVRVGQPVKVRESLRGATLDALLERHPRTPDVEAAAAELRQLRAALPSMQGRDRGLGHRDASRLAGQVAALRRELLEDVLRGAKVVCCTCASAASDTLQGVAFPLVVLDEASQSCEPESLIPLTRGAQHVVLVGDHCQLPPVCQSAEAAAGGLSVSLFERLMAAGVPSAMLAVQYRMHPGLSAFPNAAFYGGRIADGVRAEQRPPPPAFPWPSADAPVLFVDVGGGGEEVSGGGSKLNRAEAQLVKQVVEHLLTASGLPRSGIGVVTPYLAQLNLLGQLLGGLAAAPAPAAGGAGGGGAQPGDGQGWGGGGGGGGDAGGPPGAADVLEMKTVDGYQGREKEVIVFSAVRSNTNAQVGFLDDWRRLNVAITRPRRGLVLVGNAATLAAGDARWRSYLEWMGRRGCVVPSEECERRLSALSGGGRR